MTSHHLDGMCSVFADKSYSIATYQRYQEQLVLTTRKSEIADSHQCKNIYASLICLSVIKARKNGEKCFPQPAIERIIKRAKFYHT